MNKLRISTPPNQNSTRHLPNWIPYGGVSRRGFPLQISLLESENDLNIGDNHELVCCDKQGDRTASRSFHNLPVYSSSIFHSKFPVQSTSLLFLSEIRSFFLVFSAEMASESGASGASPSASFLERLISSRNRDLSMFIPFILGFADTTTRQESDDPDDETADTPTTRDRIILINPFTQGMIVIEGNSSFDSLLRELASKGGQPPASKASIEAMPSVEVGGDDGECVICLEEWKDGGVAKEMPCKHKFHENCIVKWLEIHGSCPVCRHKMPVDGEDFGKKREGSVGDEEGRGRRRVEREIWVSFSFNSNSRRSDSNQTPSTATYNDSSSSPTAEDPVTGNQ